MLTYHLPIRIMDSKRLLESDMDNIKPVSRCGALVDEVLWPTGSDMSQVCPQCAWAKRSENIHDL